MTESLVPVDQPYGERQSTVAAMRQAQMPLNPAAMGGIPADMLREVRPTAKPDMAQIMAPPPPPQVDVKQRAREMRDFTTNSTLRELLTRSLGD